MPFFGFGRWFSNKIAKDQGPKKEPEDRTHSNRQAPPILVLELAEEVEEGEEEEKTITSIPTQFSKTVRIDDTNIHNTTIIVHSDERNMKSAAKRMPKKSAFASRRKPSISKASSDGKAPQTPYDSLIIDTSSSEGYQSSRNSIQAPCKIFLRVVSNLALIGSATPATSVASSSNLHFQHREIAHGFEQRIAQLPPPPPRIASNIKLSLGHGRNGSRPAFQISTSPTRSMKSSRFIKKQPNKRVRPAS